MTQIHDDPIIRSMERTGYPPWLKYPDDEDDFDEGGDGDVYYGNSSEDF